MAFWPAIGILGLAPGIAGTAVSYLVLDGLATTPRPRAGRARPWMDDLPAPHAVDYVSSLAGTRDAVTDTYNLLAYCSPEGDAGSDTFLGVPATT